LGRRDGVVGAAAGTFAVRGTQRRRLSGSSNVAEGRTFKVRPS
jgi:hypothetical protein